MNLARIYSEQGCPACGFKLDFTPWENGVAKDKPCPCCGIHFGYDDLHANKREVIYRTWRKRWIRMGRRWWANGEPLPEFNPPWQLARLQHLENEPAK
jgi:hypothetical protein